MAGLVSDAEKYLNNPPGSGNGKKFSGTKAILFDIDDTTLNTYSYEIYSNFVFNPGTNAAFVNACLTTTCVFPAVPHMVDLEHFAESQGLHGVLPHRPAPTRRRTDARHARQPDRRRLRRRPTRQRVSQGRDGRRSRGSPRATPTCSTTQYKSLTRQHIESLGYDIVANFGDQFSDLNGGFADQTFKVPNPMYFLP